LQQSTPNQKKRREFNKKPKTTSPKMKTAKKMKNDQSQTKIKLHQLNRKILARYLYSSLDPLQQKNTLAADHARQKPKLTVSKYGVIKSQ
jgi:hypothetical protein